MRRTVSAQSIFDGTLDRKAIENRIVVIGASVAGGGDFFPTPFDSLMPGVEVISTAITHLVAGDSVVRNRKVHVADALIAIARRTGAFVQTGHVERFNRAVRAALPYVDSSFLVPVAGITGCGAVVLMGWGVMLLGGLRNTI